MRDTDGELHVEAVVNMPVLPPIGSIIQDAEADPDEGDDNTMIVVEHEFEIDYNGGECDEAICVFEPVPKVVSDES